MRSNSSSNTYIIAVLELAAHPGKQFVLRFNRRGFEEERGLVVQHRGLNLPHISQPRLHHVRDTQVGIRLAPKHALHPLGDLSTSSNNSTKSALETDKVSPAPHRLTLTSGCPPPSDSASKLYPRLCQSITNLAPLRRQQSHTTTKVGILKHIVHNTSTWTDPVSYVASAG